MSKRDKARLIKFVGILLVIIISAMFLFLKDYTKIVFQIIEKRFTSTTEGTSDVSVRARFVEYNAAWHLIEQYPMGGNGLAKWFIHYDPLDEITVLTPLIHNGYIYLVYRLGFPLTIFYMVVVFYYLVKAEKYARKIKDPLYKSLALTSFLWLVMMVLANMSSAQFVYRDGIFVMALAYAFVGICEKKYEEELQLLLPELHDGQTKLD